VNDPSGNMEMTMASIYANVACRLLQPKSSRLFIRFGAMINAGTQPLPNW
jgi:hypothetical protein